jgi:predicted glycosyltransferase
MWDIQRTSTCSAMPSILWQQRGHRVVVTTRDEKVTSRLLSLYCVDHGITWGGEAHPSQM